MYEILWVYGKYFGIRDLCALRIIVEPYPDVRTPLYKATLLSPKYAACFSTTQSRHPSIKISASVEEFDCVCLDIIIRLWCVLHEIVHMLYCDTV